MASTPPRPLVGGHQQQQVAASISASASAATAAAAIPTLRVMRLQSPELYIDQSSSSSITDSTNTVLRQSLCLPDNLTVYVG